MRILPILLLFSVTSPTLAQPVIVGNSGMLPLDRATLQRIYMGRIVEVNGVRVTPINLPPGSEIREEFLRDYLAQDEDKYIGYWTVRRYVGKGTPPRELLTTEDVLDFVAKTAGAIGYVEDAGSAPGVTALLSSSN